MDKSMLINKILVAMQPHLDSATQQILENVLILQLKDCAVTGQCTEVVVSDSGHMALLKRYIATKRIEGKSEKTLIRYYEADLKMLQGIGKPMTCGVIWHSIKNGTKSPTAHLMACAGAFPVSSHGCLLRA